MKNKLLMFFFLMFGAGTAVAATNTCDQEGYDFINPALALCEVHAYNIGDVTNPAASERELLREVIAMKTTVITKQMYRQYEQMESMLNRLKTQLEKAVLTNDLKVASGNTDDDGDGSSGGGTPVSGTFVVGAQDCRNKYQMDEALKCYEQNLATVQQQSANGENITSELKKQLWDDWTQLRTLSVASGSTPCTGSTTDVTAVKNAKDLKRKTFQTLLGDMRNCLRNKYADYNREQAQLTNKR